MKGDIILKEMKRREEMLDAHETDKVEFQRVQGEVVELQQALERKKAELDAVGAKVTQFDVTAVQAECAELRDIAVELGLIEAPVEEAVETAEEATVADPINGETVTTEDTAVGLADLI